MDRSKELLIGHFEKYPDLQIQDVFKFIYQSSFGCEHMVSSLEKATDYIKNEYEKGVPESKIEELDGDYCRVPLSLIGKGLKKETLGKIFFLSAKKEENGQEKLIEKLNIVRNLILENKLPFNIADFDKAVEKWKENGYPAIHHSEQFRNKYKPAYRLVAKKYIPFLPLFIEIDKRAESNLTIAIEGSSASGKSTLAQILNDIYICAVLHMDDFFLRPEQRTPERYNEPGGNVDRERFLNEVLIPLSSGEDILYRPFDCHTMAVIEGKKIKREKLIVIEGAYSMHPELNKYYDFSVFLDISPELQKARILKRNGQDLAQRFFFEWIPYESKYFKHFNIKEKCNVVIAVE